MVFNSFVFAAFLPIVLLVYYRLAHSAQNTWLLAASLVFYGWWDWRFLGLLGLTAVVDFVASNRIHEAADATTRRRWLLASLTTNLTILGFFKYFNFFVDTTAALLAGAGVHASLPVLRVVLPIGVSFYTFQEMAYTIDVYRGKLKPTRNFRDFLLFVVYFPQLVAGPIQRATDLMPQLQRPRRVTVDHLFVGARLVFLGLFKKVVVADALSPIVDAHFSQPAGFSGASLLLALYLFAVQIYCDFSGYTDVARGVSKLLGIDLIENFRRPYFATSITEFWHRWHISLSQWLRDYLYIPLGGSRGSTLATYRNLMLTMLLGGLWHGASWTFVVWGGLHGLFLAAHKKLLELRPAKGGEGIAIRLAKGFVTFQLVCVTWLFFRAATFGLAWTYLSRILAFSRGDLFFGSFDLMRCAVLVSSLLLIDICQEWPGVIPSWAQRPTVAGLVFGAAMVVWLSLGGVDADVPFIYFQF